jgi:hypothetical protein
MKRSVRPGAQPSAAIIMNLPSLDKYEPAVSPGGVIVANASLINRERCSTDVESIVIPANEIAEELGNKRLVNVIMVGALLAKLPILPFEAVEAAASERPGQQPGGPPARGRASSSRSCCQSYGRTRSIQDRRRARRRCQLPGRGGLLRPSPQPSSSGGQRHRGRWSGRGSWAECLLRHSLSRKLRSASSRL